MKIKLSIFAIGLLFIVFSCEKQMIEKDSEAETVKRSSGALNSDGQEFARPAARNYRTHMSGGQEVPPNTSKATGQTIFQLSKDGTSLSYKLIVANIENVTQAHIHLAPAGENGPVVAWLYPSGPPSQLIPGRTNGILMEGELTSASLVGEWAIGKSLSDLIDKFNEGEAYVNVHTSQFPPGEIRGQIK
jgi:hypothetical protein